MRHNQMPIEHALTALALSSIPAFDCPTLFQRRYERERPSQLFGHDPIPVSKQRSNLRPIRLRPRQANKHRTERERVQAGAMPRAEDLGHVDRSVAAPEIRIRKTGTGMGIVAKFPIPLPGVSPGEPAPLV